MPLDDFCVPFSGDAYRHISANRAQGVLDFSLAGLGPNNRWNSEGQRTLYLASDAGVAVAEWGRHIAWDFRFQDSTVNRQRHLFQLTLRLDRVLSLQDGRVLRAFDVAGAPNIFLDRVIARRIAARVRMETSAQGIIVPSVAFLDDPTRWNLVLFLEKLPDDASAFITEVQPLGRLGLT